MKSLVALSIGQKGAASLVVDKGHVVLNVAYTDRGYVKLEGGYPIADIVDPIKKNFIDKIKAKIPGTIDDVILDKAWAEALEAVSEK